MRGSDTDRARTRLRLGIGLFVLALAIPSALLVGKAYDQLKWEAFRQQQLAAEELADRIDQAFLQLARIEDARSIDDYGFLVRADEPPAGYRRRSPLAELPSGEDAPPGALGWFQVAADGRFSSPLVPEPGILPSELGIAPAELAMRQARAQRIEGILIGNRLVERSIREPEPVAMPSLGLRSPSPDSAMREEQAAPLADAESFPRSRARPQGARYAGDSEPPASNRLSQAAFERLASGAPLSAARPAKAESKASKQIADLKLDSSLAERLAKSKDERMRAELERDTEVAGATAYPAALPGRDQTPVAEPERRPASARPVQLFDTTLEPCELGWLSSGHLLLFRSVWRQGERIIQGLLIEQTAFLEALIGRPFAATALARTTDLSATYRGEVMASFEARPDNGRSTGSYRLAVDQAPLTGALLYRARLQEPFGGIELVFSVSRLPSPPGGALIGWVGAALGMVLVAGGWLMYRLGSSQLELASQQRDFISAVSHELKTPLTSIRMYAEMLRAGFAPPDRHETYYRYIQEESERLSRLIANVLQLARIGRNALRLEPRPMAVGDLLQLVEERVRSQVEGAGFRLEIGCRSRAFIQVDPDAFVQILINLVDNALKFASELEPRLILVDCEDAGARLRIKVRDFGPGIPKDQRRQVFRLFYRGPAARQRAIAGTGIGLALVQRLTREMGGEIRLVAHDQGSEFQIELPVSLERPDGREDGGLALD